MLKTKSTFSIRYVFFNNYSSLVRQEIDSSRIYYRDFQNFFSILIDDSIRKTLCRLYLTETMKEIAFLDEKRMKSDFP